MKIGSIIVTFNPRIEQLRLVLNALAKQTQKIRIVDNNSTNLADIMFLMRKFNNIELIKLDSNMGIAVAQNKGFSAFRQEDYDWVLTLDQDTVIPNDYILQLTVAMPLKDAGIVTGTYIDVKWNKERIEKVKLMRKPSIQKINEEISSGNLVSIEAWQHVGGFTEELFIDYVDFDFDYKLTENGYNIYRVNDAEFQHEIGSSVHLSWVTKILWLNKRELFDHSAQRLYYINRNRLIVRKRHPQSGSSIRMLFREVLNLREVLAMKSPRIKKIRFAILGIIEGALYK